MSEFASMLASFKRNANTSTTQSPAVPKQQGQQTRKRPHPKIGGSNVRSTPTPHFPSMHSDRKKKGGFELSFLVIGAQKAGTSWLHTLLQKCDRIALPHGQKEVHFWDWKFRQGFEWYIRQFDFPKTSSHHKARLSSGTNSSLFYGEITPCYIVLPPPTIAEIQKCFPGIKLVFVARDLVDRAWSAIIMELRDQTMGLNPGEFAEGVIPGDKQKSEGSKRAKTSKEATMSVAQQRRLQQQSSPSAQPDSYYLDRLRSETHASRSDYATHLAHWYTHFPSKNILIVDYRDIETDPRGVLKKVVMHIGLEEEDAKAYVEQLNESDVRQRVNAATNTKLDSDGSSTAEQKATMSQCALSQRPHLRKQFEQYLRPFAKKFNSLLEKEGYSLKLNEY